MSVSTEAPLLGNIEGRSFPKAFERRDKFIYLGEFYKEFERYVKRPCKRAALSIRVLLGNLEGVHLLRLLRENDNAYLGPLFLDPEDINI